MKINPRSKALMQNIYLKLFLSSMIAIFFGNLGQIVGSMIVGNAISGDKLAIISLALPVYYAFATVGNLAGIGGGTLAAKHLGRGDTDKCNKTYTVTYLFTIAVSVLLAILIIVLLPVLVPFLGAGGVLYDDLYNYAFAMSAGGVFIALAYLSFNFLRLDGNAVATTMSFVVMAAVNIIFDFLLLLIIPIGVVGVASATCIGAAASSLFGYLYIKLKSAAISPVRVSMNDFKKYSIKICRIGAPGGIENVAILLRSYFLNQIILSFAGEMALSSLAVVNSVNSFAQAIIAGAAGALVPLLGVFIGEKDNTNIRRIEMSAYLMGAIFLAVFMGIVIGFAPFVSVLFGMTDYEGTIMAIRIFSLSLPFCLISNIMLYSHIADGHSAIASLMTLFRNFAISLLSAFVLMKLYGEVGLWVSYSVCEIITILAGLICHAILRIRHKNLSFFLLLDRNVDKDSEEYSCVMLNYKEQIGGLSENIEAFCERMELLPKQTMLINLALEELLVAIAAHTPESDIERAVSIRIFVYKDIIVMRLRYAGDLFNPIAYYESLRNDENNVDALLELDDSLGIKMITDTAENVDYRLTFGINNLTVIL